MRVFKYQCIIAVPLLLNSLFDKLILHSVIDPCVLSFIRMCYFNILEAHNQPMLFLGFNLFCNLLTDRRDSNTSKNYLA